MTSFRDGRRAFVVLVAGSLLVALGAGGAATAAVQTTEPVEAGAIPEAQDLLEALLVRPTELPTTEPIDGDVPTGLTIDWIVCGRPFLTKPGDLVDAVGRAIKAVTGIETKISTTGGTSDGRFIADICPQVIEFGPTNATIHKVNECIRVDEIEPLSLIYQQILVNLLVR